MKQQSQLKSSITTIKKHLIDCGCTFEKKSENSNSVYLKFMKITFRISDHFSPISCKGVNIVVSINGKFSLTVNGGLLIYDKIGELKTFLRNYCEMQACNNIVNMNIVCEKIGEQTEKLNKLKADVVNANSSLMKINSQINNAEKQIENVKYLKFSDDFVVDLSVLTGKQKAKLLQYANAYAKQMSKN